MLRGSGVLIGNLARWLSLNPLLVGSPGPGEEVAVRIPQELPVHGVQEPLERPQAPRPLLGPTLQSGHDRTIRHGEELGIGAETEGPQGVKTVDHVHGVAAGAHRVGGLVLLDLGEVAAKIAAPLYLPPHVDEHVSQSPLGNEDHVIGENDDVPNRRGVLAVVDDLGDVCLYYVS